MSGTGSQPRGATVSYDEIGRPVVQDGLMRGRFDDTSRRADAVVQVSRGCSAAARGCLHVPAHGELGDTVTCACCQVHRRVCEVAGVLLLGSDGAFFSFEIEIRTHCGLLRACVQLSRALLERARLAPWSEGELAVLFFLQSGVPRGLNLAKDVRWWHVAGLLGTRPIATKLGELTGLVYDPQDICRVMQDIHDATQNAARGQKSFLVEGSLVFVLEARQCVAGTEDAATGGAGARDHHRKQHSEAPVEAAGFGRAGGDTGDSHGSFSELLKGTAVVRQAFAPSNSAWRRMESCLTTFQSSDGKMRRVRVGGELLGSMQRYQMSLARHHLCCTVLNLPRIRSLHGQQYGNEQLRLADTARDIASPVSLASVPCNGSNSSNCDEPWRELAATAAQSWYRPGGRYQLWALGTSEDVARMRRKRSATHT
jgi:hypothetical protein